MASKAMTGPVTGSVQRTASMLPIAVRLQDFRSRRRLRSFSSEELTPAALVRQRPESLLRSAETSVTSGSSMNFLLNRCSVSASALDLLPVPAQPPFRQAQLE